jgi:FHA domain-containing protein
MNLVIRAHSLKTETLSQSITGHFDERGGTIGRSDTNTLSLPDPERHISRLQAEISFANSGFSIRNVGSANAITINGRPVNPGEGSPIADDDELVIGGYSMRANVTAGTWDPPTENTPTDSRTVIRTSAPEPRTHPRMRAALGGGAGGQPRNPTSGNPFADLLGSGAGGGADPFAGLSDGTPANPPTTAVHVRKPSAPRQPSTGSARLPDDFDPFSDLPPSTPPASSTDAALASFMGGAAPGPSESTSQTLPDDLGSLANILGTPASAPPSSLDAMFGLSSSGNSRDDPLAAFLSPSRAEGSGTPMPSTDPLAMFGTLSKAPAAPAIPEDFDRTPEMKSAYVPPAVAPSPSPFNDLPTAAQPLAKAAPVRPTTPRSPGVNVPPVRTASRFDDTRGGDTVPGMRPRTTAFESSGPAPLDALPAVGTSSAHLGDAGAGDLDALWAAFCEGAGISLHPPQGLNPALMKVIGQVLAHSIDGTLKLVAVRAAAKQELRADVTLIQARNNNPLKFSPDAGAAIQQLLQPPMRGFMVGPAAVGEVMDDLLGHAIGTMAGMRAALEGVLGRFEPSQLEGKLAGNSVLDAVLPMNRRAKLWELYLQHYQRIHDEAQDDFHDLFGKAFIAAYEEQLDRLDAARHPV